MKCEILHTAECPCGHSAYLFVPPLAGMEKSMAVRLRERHGCKDENQRIGPSDN